MITRCTTYSRAMLFRYFDWRISMGRPLSAWTRVIAAVFAPLLSMVISSGAPLPITATPDGSAWNPASG